MTINPYLTFNGNCEEAFEFYKSVFGGDFIFIGRFKDMPSEYLVSNGIKEKIMHVSLPVGNGTVLMGSDNSEEFGHTTVSGNNFSISINSDNVQETTRLYNELSSGGKIKMPLEKTFWGSYFGMFTDKFGIHWMVNCDLKEQNETKNIKNI